MAISLKQAREYSADITKKLTGGSAEWRGFLRTAGNLYKYSFPDQMMTYAQRPDATATASYGVWMDVGRHVRRGSSGIALFRPDGRGLKYVFDVSDTGYSQHRKQQHHLMPWKMKKRTLHPYSRFWKANTE